MCRAARGYKAVSSSRVFNNKKKKTSLLSLVNRQALQRPSLVLAPAPSQPQLRQLHSLSQALLGRRGPRILAAEEARAKRNGGGGTRQHRHHRHHHHHHHNRRRRRKLDPPLAQREGTLAVVARPRESLAKVTQGE